MSGVRLGEGEREALLTAVRDAGHTLTTGNVVATERNLRIAVEAILAARLAAVEALADEWIAGDDLTQWGDHTRGFCGRDLRAALAAATPPGRSDGGGGGEVGSDG